MRSASWSSAITPNPTGSTRFVLVSNSTTAGTGAPPSPSGDAGFPAALAEGQQDRGIGDPGTIVDESNSGGVAVLLDGCGDAVGTATA